MSAPELDRVRDRLISWAEHETAVTGVDLTGSLATGHADRWSDLEPTLVRALDADEILRALAALVPLLLDELRLSDPDTAERLAPTLSHWAHR